MSHAASRMHAVATALAVWLAVAAPRADATLTRPFVGIAYIDRTITAPRRAHLHVVQIDLTAEGVRLKLSPPGGSRETLRERTVDFLARERAQVAINAHFFLPFPSDDRDAWLIGLAASDGRVFSGFERPEQRYAIVADAPALNVDAANHASIVHRDRRARDRRRVQERVTLWNTVSGSAQIVTRGAKTIPTYADGTHPNARLAPGGPRRYSNRQSWYDVATARSAIGVSRDGRMLTLFTVDARGDSDGLRVGEVADLLLGLGVWNALNLDGGGSTSLAMEDPETHQPRLVNTSSDNPAGRAVGSNLAVFAKGWK